MNRCRLRRMLCHLVLDWDHVQYEAESLDAELRQYVHEEPIREAGEEIWCFPLSSWAYYHKLKQLEWIVQMGYELEVYRIDELGGMYWYVDHRVTKALVTPAGLIISYKQVFAVLGHHSLSTC